MIVCVGLGPAGNRERSESVGFILKDRVEMNVWCGDGFQAEQISDDRCTLGDRRQERRRIETDVYKLLNRKEFCMRVDTSRPSSS